MCSQKRMTVGILSWAVADAKMCNPFECELLHRCVTNPANVARLVYTIGVVKAAHDCGCFYIDIHQMQECEFGDAFLQEIPQALVSLLEQSSQLQWWVVLCCWFWQLSSFAAAARGGTQEQLPWKLLQ